MFSPLLFTIFFTTTLGLQVVQTSYGRIRGITDFSNPDNSKHSFKGVPFTKPPLGKLRFRLPEPPESWNGIWDASKYKPGCTSYYTSTVEEHSQSEDCLYMNIFTSDRCLRKSCPVIVFFHGGAFTAAIATMMPAKSILDRYVEQDVVFVVPAFRLGVLGQFYLGDEGLESNATIPNLLVHDCIAALKFINQEIKAFGGNPNDVTLMGHSSGGSLVDALGFSPKIDPDQKLFHKLLVLSAFGTFALEDQHIKNSYEVAKRMGCTSNSKQEIVSCMQEKMAEDIYQIQENMEKNDYLYFKNLLLKEPLIKGKEKIADLKRNPAPRKILYGCTEHEFEQFQYDHYYVTGFFLDFENPVETTMFYRNTYSNTSSAFVNSDSSAVYIAASTYSQAIVNSGGDAYLFETRQKPYSTHTSDIQYYMGTKPLFQRTKDMDILDSFYSQMLVNFTKFGEPSPNWKKLDPKKMNFLVMEVDMEMGIMPHMEEGFHEELVDFWMINMTEIDKKITQQKQQGIQVTVAPKVPDVGVTVTKAKELSALATLTTLTTLKPTKNTVSSSSSTTTTTTTSTSPTKSDNNPMLTDETSSSIYQQWWFYVIVIFAFLVLVFACCALFRSTKEEEQALLG